MKFIFSLLIFFTLFVSSTTNAMIIDNPDPEASDFARAEAGDWGSQSKLGYYYLNEHFGIRPDGAESEKWYVRSARQDVKSIQYALGFLYLEGSSGFPRSDEKAYYWLYAFKTSSNPLSYPFDFKRVDVALAKMAAMLTPQAIATIEQQVVKWRENLKPEKNSGGCLSNEKLEYLLNLAEKGDAQAQFDFAEAFYFEATICSSQEKDSVIEDLFKKFNIINRLWIEWSAEQGYLPAQVIWANMLDMDKQSEESIIWKRKAAEQGGRFAQQDLSQFYKKKNKSGISSDGGLNFVEEMWFWHNLAAYRVYWTAEDRKTALAHLGQQQFDIIEKRLRAWKPSPTASTLGKFQEDAQKADFESQMMLARFSLYGDSPSRDFSEGYFWLLAAVKYLPEEAIPHFKSRDYDGMKNEAEKNLTPEQIAAVRQRVKNWKPKL